MPVSDAEIAVLASGHDILTLGMLADEVRRGLHGLRTTFLRVADVPVDPGAPLTLPDGAGEFRIVGAPASLAAAVARVSAVRGISAGVPVSGFSLADLEALAAKESATLRELLEALQAAGLELVAEAPIDRLQDPRRSIEEVNIAGLALARATIDRMETADAVPVWKRVAALQRSVAVLRAFAPLPRRVNPAVPTTGYDDVKGVALARLICDNIPSIQVDWRLYGPKLAQVALTVGADDLDAVSASDGTGEGRRRSALEDVRRNIRAAGRFELVTT
jgi:aminodeoxyfutalosine synthase